MKMSKILAVVLAAIMLVACFAACDKGNKGDDNTTDLSGTYDITMWVSEKEGVTALTQQQIDAFEAAAGYLSGGIRQSQFGNRRGPDSCRCHHPAIVCLCTPGKSAA